MVNDNQRPSGAEYALSRANLLNEAYKGLLVVNGGGIVALLGFLQAIWDKSPGLAKFTLHGIAFLAIGLALALMIPFFRYHHSRYAQRKESQGETEPKGIFWYIYFVCQYSSIVFFGGGASYLVVRGLSIIRGVAL